MTVHSCPACKHDCGCLVEKHTGNCVHHKHEWSYDYYYQDNPSDKLVYCWGCRRNREEIRKSEDEVREYERRARDQRALEKDMAKYE